MPRSGGARRGLWVAASFWLLALWLALYAPPLSAAEATSRFATPEDAVAALAAAAKVNDVGEMRKVLGPGADDIVNPDRVQAGAEFANFAAALIETNRVVRESDSLCVLELGRGAWPFPIPIVKTNGAWSFDVAAGREELLNRRIGRNELSALQVVRAYVEAQRQYASQDYDGDDVLEYAQRLFSPPGTHDGLYWPAEIENDISPLGPLVAQAEGEGYALHSHEKNTPPQPFYGYFFKILTRQGRHPPGGRYDYVINGNMIGGFALVGWPAQYGETGVMTFIVNQQGRVYQKDLGPKTGRLAPRMKEYDPDTTWRLSGD